jgi:hypothetical protein
MTRWTTIKPDSALSKRRHVAGRYTVYSVVALTFAAISISVSIIEIPAAVATFAVVAVVPVVTLCSPC